MVPPPKIGYGSFYENVISKELCYDHGRSELILGGRVLFTQE